MKHNKTKVTVEKDLSIDAIAMKRQLQKIFYEETKDLSPEELIAYIHRQVAESEFADYFSLPSPSPANAPEEKTNKAIDTDKTLTPNPRQK